MNLDLLQRVLLQLLNCGDVVTAKNLVFALAHRSNCNDEPRFIREVLLSHVDAGVELVWSQVVVKLRDKHLNTGWTSTDPRDNLFLSQAPQFSVPYLEQGLL